MGQGRIPMGDRVRRGIVLSASLVLIAAAFQAAPPSPELVLWWTLDDAVTTDASGTGNTGTVAGGPTAQAADKAPLTFPNIQSMSFDGSDDQVTRAAVTGLAAGNTAHTIAAWIKISAFPPSRAWIALLGNPGAGAHHWLIDQTGATQFGCWGPFPGGNQKNPVLPADGQWRHVAAVFDGTNLEIYLNGTAIPGGPIASAFDLQGVPLTIAQKQFAESNFPGLMDDIRVYARALTLAEVQYLAAGNGPPAAPQNFMAQGGVNSIDLSWDAVAGATTYTVRRGSTSGGPYSTIVFSGSGTTFTDTTGLVVGTPYYYVVTAFHSAGGEGAASAQATATAQAAPPPPPRSATVGNESDRCGCGSIGATPRPRLLLLLPVAAFLLLAVRRR